MFGASNDPKPARQAGHTEDNTMAKRQSNKAKVKVWTETLTSEFEGPILGCALELFAMIPGGKESREKALQLMQERHQGMCEREEQREKEAAKCDE